MAVSDAHPLTADPRVTGRFSEEELKKVLLFTDPVVWGQQMLYNRDGTSRSYWPHQIEDLHAEDRNIIHLDGRDVGKSINLTTDALFYAFTTVGGSGLIAAPLQGHLDNIIEEVEFQFDTNPALADSIAVTPYGKLKISRKPYYRVEFKNKAVLYFRPGGAYGDAFRSLHVMRVWLDEGAWLTEQAWKALRQCLKKGGRMRIYSTPNGLRNTTYYRLTTDKKANFRVFRWPSWLNPAWDKERESELLDFYGGKETAGWQHEVAGEHGKPAYGAFDIEAFHKCRCSIPEYRNLEILGDDLSDCGSEDDVKERFELLLDMGLPEEGRYWLGGDLGYTNDPCELFVARELPMPDSEKGKLEIILRLHLEHVAYPYVSLLLGMLDERFHFLGMGVDNGGNGLSVVQELHTMDKFRHLHLIDDVTGVSRLRGFDFGGSTVVGENANGQEIKKRTKEFMTTCINGRMRRGQIAFPDSDADIEDQITTQTYTLSNGNVIYSKGNDHINDALRCLALVHELAGLELTMQEELVSLMPVVTDGVFV